MSARRALRAAGGAVRPRRHPARHHRRPRGRRQPDARRARSSGTQPGGDPQLRRQGHPQPRAALHDRRAARRPRPRSRPRWRVFRHHYARVNGARTRIYPGVTELLDALRGRDLPLARGHQQGRGLHAAAARAHGRSPRISTPWSAATPCRSRSRTRRPCTWPARASAWRRPKALMIGDSANDALRRPRRRHAGAAGAPTATAKACRWTPSNAMGYYRTHFRPWITSVPHSRDPRRLAGCLAPQGTSRALILHHRPTS